MIEQSSLAVIQTKTKVRHPLMTKDVINNYQKLLSFSNLQLHKQITHRNIQISQQEHIHQIYTISPINLPHLVFIHGYGGTAATGLKLFKSLSPFFQIHAIDLTGFGFSSKGKFQPSFSYDQAIQYYLKPIQQWVGVLGIQSFYLVGHSFGGYIASCYAFRHQDKIKRLFLLSPAGASPHYQYQKSQQKGCLKLIYLNIAQTVYNWNITPTQLAKSQIIGDSFINVVVNKKLQIPKNQQAQWRSYLKVVSTQPNNSQLAFYRIFQYPISPKITIQNMIRKFQHGFEIDFYFGEHDWMARDGIDGVVRQKIRKVNIETVPGASHQIIADNCQYVCQSVIGKTGCLKRRKFCGFEIDLGVVTNPEDN